MSNQHVMRSDPVRLGLMTTLVTIALILFPAVVAHADEFHVDMTADDAGATACTNAANDCSLRGAVSAANTNPGADTIVLPDRVFDLTLKSVLPPEDGNLSGDLDISASGGSLRIMGEGAGATIIRGGSKGGIEAGIDRVFHIDPAAVGGIRVEISGVSIQYGYASGYGGGVLIEGDNRVELIDSSVISNTVLVVGTPGGGGGIFNDEGTLVLENTDVMTNTAHGVAQDSDVAGGGILVEFTGVLTLTGSTVSGNGASALQLTGSSIRGGGLANLHGEVNVSDSTIRNNRASAGAAGSLGLGGGIANVDAGRLTIDQNSVVSDNMADLYGGGLANMGSPAWIEGSTFSANKAAGGADGSASKGGGIYNKIGTVQIISSTIESNESVTLETPDELGTGGGIANAGGTVELTDSRVRANIADSNCGGIRNENGSTLSMEGVESALSQNEAGVSSGGLCNLESSAFLTDTTISLNTAEGSGGGITDSDGNVSLTRCMISGNKAYDGYGGGIHDAFGTLHIVDSMVFSNFADVSGGGLYSLLSTTHITGTTFSENAAADLPTGGTYDNHGGGLFLYGGTTHVVNSTISGNRADESGGGVFGDGATLSLSFTTVADNVADDDNDGHGDGGGIFEGVENPSIVNTILAGNVDKGGEANNCGGPGVYTLGGNIIQNRGCTVVGGTGTNWTSDPLLGPLGDNGGPTDTHALLVGSPAIDRVTNDCRTFQALVLTEDQRGVSRPIGAACDIGAYEAAIVYLPLVARNW